jgi:hypothetical protein
VAILIALVVSIWVDAAWALPARAVKAFAASTCCATHCARLAGAVCEKGCCPLTGSPNSPVIQRDGSGQHRTDLAPVAETVASPVTAALSPSRPNEPSERAGSDPPTLFLLTRTLRI